MDILRNKAGEILPLDIAEDLIITPLKSQAVTMNPAVSTTVITGAHEWHAPRLDKGAQASWVAEGQEIPLSDIQLSEVTVAPAKAAALSVLSRELAQDSSPDAQQIIGNSMVNDIKRVVDQAFLTNMATPAPAGLASLTDATEVTLDLANLDSFAEAQFAAEGVGAHISSFIVSPDDALQLAQLKVSSGSNETLLQGQRTINDVPVIVAPQLATGTVYGLDASRVYTVVRDEIRLDVDESVYFTSDRIAVRTTMRVGFGFAHPTSVIKMVAA